MSDYTSADSDGAPTLYHLYREIRRDPALSVFESQRLINEVRDATQAPSFAPLNRTVMKGLGAAGGYVVGKFFGMNGVGKALTTAIGLGVGAQLANKMEKPKERGIRGWKILGQ